MKIVLYQPEIPQNTGNIIRTCSVTGVELVLIKPLAFKLSDKHLKRAGLDYHDQVKITIEDDLSAFLGRYPENPFYFFSSKGSHRYTDIQLKANDIYIFGSETSGLPSEILNRWPSKILTLPMASHARCLNLSNTAAIVVYESLRQQNFNFPPVT